MCHSTNGTTKQCQQIARAALKGLHDLAQPLTTAQGILELSLYQQHSASEYRRAIERAVVELSRIVPPLNYLQQLVRMQEQLPELTSVPFSQVVRAAVKDIESATAGADRTRIMFIPGTISTAAVLACRKELHRALLLLFSYFLAEGSKEEVFHAIVEEDTQMVSMRLAAVSDGESVASDFAARDFPAALRFTETVLCSMGGDLTISPKPYGALARLPKAKTMSSGHNTANPPQSSPAHA